MFNIGIFPNTTRDINLEYTRNLISWLIINKCNIYVTECNQDLENVVFTTIDIICKKCDFVIFLGGDGTILQKAPICAKFNIPLIGINLGSVGYLTDVDKEDGTLAIGKVLQKNYRIEKRMLIETKVKGETKTALNDICITKKDQTKLITLTIKVNGEYIDTYRGDGIIVSTPTGSTAYNLAAGGPIVKPDICAIIVTPICPYKIYSRPLVLSGDDIVTISSNDYFCTSVSVDGYMDNLTEEITIKKSINKASIIRTHKQNFYDVLRKKFFI
ncbi:MAG: NAD(+)/NADH kinase [Defluviitaleaceae bacterium]|nr:NAD(+)/NADH kinase [Defluviitaleaceae bacterium]